MDYTKWEFFDDEFAEVWHEFLVHRKRLKKPMTDYAQKLALNKLRDMSIGNKAKAIDIINQSILEGWVGLWALKDNFNEIPRVGDNRNFR